MRSQERDPSYGLMLAVGFVLSCGVPDHSAATPPSRSASDGVTADRPTDEFGEAPRRFFFDYETRIGPLRGDGWVHVFIPIAAQTEHQTILSLSIEADIPGAIETELEHGNRYWHGVVPAARGEAIEIAVRYEVERRHFHRKVPTAPVPDLTAAQRAKLARFLEPDERVPVGHEILDPIVAEIRSMAGSSDRARLARAIYDWVVANLEYKKLGTGWGNGDTFWACSARYGNCTDFHSLFISLARTEGIPARFEMGFPVPLDRSSGTIAGYHCWIEFFLPKTGWFPIDASEAFKYPDRREEFFGTHPTDRIHFSTGRDLRLGADHHGHALNYFIYPYVEVGGKPYDAVIENRFSYRSVR